MEETSESHVDTVLEPIEQHTIIFYGKPLVAVRLPDSTPAVVFNHLCENMGLERTAQVRRVRRKKSLAKGFYAVRIHTDGGPQVVNALALNVTAGWLFGIEAGQADPDKREDIERYQDRCKDVLYQWASAPRLEEPTGLVNAEPVVKPETPGQGASREQWRDYFLQMAAFTDWQISVEQWQGSVEGRLESLEAIIPVIPEQLPPPTITARHQNDVKHYVIELAKATHKHPQTVWSMVYTAFQVPRYEELREDRWDVIQDWFRKHFNTIGLALPGEEQKRLF